MFRSFLRTFLVALAGMLLAACQLAGRPGADITVELTADGLSRTLQLPTGSTVADALSAAGLTLGPLDRSVPEPFVALKDGDHVRVVRVREEFSTRQEVVPFGPQVVRNESLPEGQTRLIQPGVNGLDELTVRSLYEDGVLVSQKVVKRVTLQPPVPEIVMVGAQTAFAPVQIPGRLAYLAAGNAWVMEGTTADRRALVTTGDLDGRVFALSPDGNWLLFTRKSSMPAEQQINTLWVVSVTQPNAQLVNLKVANIVHFAGWVPGEERTVAYSTVEPRRTAPGWQANNDLWRVRFLANGTVQAPQRLVNVNSGGIYGWWGTTYAWSPDGTMLLYARPDGIGRVDVENGALVPLQEITPLLTRSDWAWVPGLVWGADSRVVYWVNHAPPPAMVSAEESPNFDLAAFSLVTPASVALVEGTGMFSYPSVSPLLERGGERGYRVAYLQAVFPQQSETSRYRLVVMDRDGSNRRALFPPPDVPGLEPQAPVWAPALLPGQDDLLLAVIHQGNLYLVNSGDGSARQVTGDGLLKRVDWK